MRALMKPFASFLTEANQGYAIGIVGTYGHITAKKLGPAEAMTAKHLDIWPGVRQLSKHFRVSRDLLMTDDTPTMDDFFAITDWCEREGFNIRRYQQTLHHSPISVDVFRITDLREAVAPGTPGDCFRNANKWNAREGRDTDFVVHGTVTNGEGRSFVHAWIERGNEVIDPTTGSEMSKSRYYGMLHVRDVTRYTSTEAIRKQIRSGHHGPWELNESLGSPLSWKWEKKRPGEHYLASFDIQGIHFEVVFLRWAREWGLTFGPNTESLNQLKTDDRYGVLGTGNEFKIFSTVVDILKRWLPMENPNLPVEFTAKEDSRKKLYARFARTVEKAIPGWAGYEADYGTYHIVRDTR
jgi:hypothetical protein